MIETAETFWTDGLLGAVVSVEIVRYADGVAVATAEQERITERQFMVALNREFPQYDWRDAGPNGCGYWLTSARRK